jgi:hypothetical protein
MEVFGKDSKMICQTTTRCWFAKAAGIERLWKRLRKEVR